LRLSTLFLLGFAVWILGGLVFCLGFLFRLCLLFFSQRNSLSTADGANICTVKTDLAICLNTRNSPQLTAWSSTKFFHPCPNDRTPSLKHSRTRQRSPNASSR
jgi:hypothetical protein